MKLELRIAGALLTFGAFVASTALVACSSDDSSSNPTPTAHDSGVTTQPDSTVPVTNDDGGTNNADTGPGIDASLPDVGACTSDASTCNSCYTPQQDPVNGCSSAAANCIKFDNTRVPTGAP